MQQKQIGRYQIKEVLGAGGMGQVYRAFDPQRNRDVALKVINLAAIQRFSDEEQDKVLERFYHEVRVIAQLQHPAIVPLFDSGDDNRTPYMVMPLMGGGSLEKYLRDKQGNPQPLPFAEIERILTWITPALDKMHAQKVIHRDLKPDNILFDDEYHAYIADFGIAKLTEGSITFNTGQIGTPAYMSPEQADGQKKVDARSDVYSLGAILYKMLTGERPYHKASPLILPIYHIQEPPPRLDELRTDLSPNWQAIIDRAMAKKPEERYQTAGQLSAAVTQLLRNEAEREARERKAREEAVRQAELARLRREAQTARKQADMARQQALQEKKKREAALLEAESAIPLLSRINLLDHLRLLWWMLVMPQQLKLYQGQHGEEAIKKTGAWLGSTLICLPFVFPILAFGLGTLPYGPDPLSAVTYLSISGGLSLAWLFLGLFGERGDRSVAFLVAFSVLLLIVAFGGVCFGVILEMLFGYFGVIVGVIVGIMAFIVGLGVMLGIQLRVGYIIYFFAPALIIPYFSLIFIAPAIQDGLETGEPSRLGRGVFAALVAAYAFLLWFCFLGGWQAFA